MNSSFFNMIWDFWGPKEKEDCLNTVVMLLWFKMWRAWACSFKSGEHSSVWRGKVHICMSPCLALRFCFLARNASLGPTALRLCWWMSYNSACVFCNANRLLTGTVFTSESLKLPHIQCSWCGSHFLFLAVRLVRYIPLNKVCSPHSNPITSKRQEQWSSIPIKSY